MHFRSEKMRKKVFLFMLLAIASAAVLYLAFIVKSIPSNKPNIVLIISEDHGQHLSCYGDTVIQTPHLDALAADGVVFWNAYVTQAVCSPSRSSILTGLYPHQSGHLGLATHGYRMVGEIRNIYGILKNEGYRTGMIGKLHVNPEESFPIDYQPIKDPNFTRQSLDRYKTYADEFINKSEGPFFLTVSFPDAHWPFKEKVEGRPKRTVAPEEITVFPYIGWDNVMIRSYVANIYNCILRLDECVGELMEVLKISGKEKNTIVIYLSDHGDQMARGKFDVYEASNRVPFIIKWPDKTAKGAVSEALVSSIDIVPTIMDVLGLPKDSRMTGISLLPVLRQPRLHQRNYLFTERNGEPKGGYFPQRAIRNHRFKLIYTLLDDRINPMAQFFFTDNVNPVFGGGPKLSERQKLPDTLKRMYQTWERPPKIQLYDLVKDPWEFHNLSDDPDYHEEKINLFQRLTEWQLETDDPLRFPDKLRQLTFEHDTISWSKLKQDWKYPEYLYGGDKN